MAAIGFVEFRDGDVVQGWNPQLMTRKTRRQIAECLEKIAAHMRIDKFEDDGEYRKFALPKRKVKK